MDALEYKNQQDEVSEQEGRRGNVSKRQRYRISTRGSQDMAIKRFLGALSVLAVLLIGSSDATAATSGPRLAYDKIVGVYFGNEPSVVAPFEQWFGRPVGGILAYGNDDSNWGAFDSRQFVQTFRSVSPRFKFEWTPAIGNKGMNPEDAYPGDDVVDIIGMDVYHNRTWNSPDGKKAFEYKRTEQYGLQWHKNFSATHGKRMAYSEWGINIDSPDYVQLMHDWFLSNNVVYQTYWNSDASFRGKLSHYPNAAARYKTLFSKW